MASPSPRPAESALETRPYRAGDGPAINRAFNEVFSLQRPQEEWQWKFRADAGGSRILLVVDRGSGEVLAQFAVIRVPFRVGKRVHAAALSVDDFCRRRADLVHGKAYTRMVRRFHETYGRSGTLDFLYGFPGMRHLRLLLHQGGYEPPVEVPYYERPAGRPGLAFSLWRTTPFTSAPAMDDLYARCADRYAAGVLRDGAWLQHRYLAHPSRPYLSVAATLGGRAHAWGAFRLLGDRLAWVDLLWDGRQTGALKALGRWADRTAGELGAKALTLWLNGDDAAAAALARLGWIRRPNPLPLAAMIIRYHADLPPRLLPRAYFTMGDSDLF